MSYRYLNMLMNETIRQGRAYVENGILPFGFDSALPLVDRLTTRLEVLLQAYSASEPKKED